MTKADYQRKIWTYRKRRDVFRNRCHKLSVKIRRWEACLRERESVEKKRKIVICNLVKKTNEYFQVDIKTRVTSKGHTLARNIFYKIGLESNISGIYLSKFIGRSQKKALLGRKELLTSFKHNKKNKEAYHNFKNFLENNNQ